jgi:DNA helicase-2/ATP-dependent DNA helicase PcrA
MPTTKIVLTPQQRAVVAHDRRLPARVLAGPGTGKSATLVALVSEILKEKPAPRARLLTFTRAATAELAYKLEDHPAAIAERPSTIHSFAISVLLRNGSVGNLPRPLRIADDWERREIVRSTLAARAGVGVRRLDLLLRELAANWESLTKVEEPTVTAAERSQFMGAWQEHRAIYGYTLLAELPWALRNALRDHPDLKGVNYNVLLVDEYQDLNACDLDVLKLIAARGCSIIAAGDDEQSIFSLRKAAPEGILRFFEDYPTGVDYPLTITQRCGRSIVDWANFVIVGDPNRDKNRPVLTCATTAPAGEVAFLSFGRDDGEAKGVATMVERLIDREGLDASDILILLRTDHNRMFSRPIRQELARRGIAVSDPDEVKNMMAERANRYFVEVLRLMVNRMDSVAWASLIKLTDGIGRAFIKHIYDLARDIQATFGEALLKGYTDDFIDAPSASRAKANALLDRVIPWLDYHKPPADVPDEGWGRWAIDLSDANVLPTPTPEFRDLLLELDTVAEAGQALGRFLGQVQPLGEDLASARAAGVRIMSMSRAKGLTVQAAVIAGVENNVIPRPGLDLGEERRLFYVAMTRARSYLYLTWARRRQGPTARSGKPQVWELRQHSPFLDGGPVESTDGPAFIRRRWPA